MKTQKANVARRPWRVGVVTLGCDKNTVDAEYIAGFLARGDAVAVPGDIDDADLDAAVILTCGFIEPARVESHDAIRDWVDSKRSRPTHFTLAVAGCLSQSATAHLVSQYPAIDVIAGVGEFEALSRALLSRLEEKLTWKEEEEFIVESIARSRPDVRVEAPMARQALDECATAYLKIADGCNHGCAFCVIPRIKGRYHSVPPELLEGEAMALIERGAREIVLVAQDVSPYGADLDASIRLPGLLRELCALPGDFWVRILYFYPGGLTDELIETITTEPRVCHYLDLPLQHLDPELCAAMKRPDPNLRILESVEKLRRRIPDIALRASFIVGFPGETDEAFRNLYDGLERIRFDHVGFFPFSPEEGTAAASMAGHVPPEAIEERLELLAARQYEIAEERNERFVGRTLEALVDGRFPDTDLYIGHTRYQAPAVDGMTRFVSGRELSAGEVAQVRIDRVDGVDLVGTAV